MTRYLTLERAKEVANGIRNGLGWSPHEDPPPEEEVETLLAMALDAAKPEPTVDRAWALVRQGAEMHAALVAEGLPPLKDHEILAPFREAGCLFERKVDADETWVEGNGQMRRVLSGARARLAVCAELANPIEAAPPFNNCVFVILPPNCYIDADRGNAEGLREIAEETRDRAAAHERKR